MKQEKTSGSRPPGRFGKPDERRYCIMAEKIIIYGTET
jgi:hypothetical protein